MKQILILSVISFLIFSCDDNSTSSSVVLKPESTSGLVSGKETYEYEGAVFLFGNTRCTGALVGLNPPTVITARHCVSGGAQVLNMSLPKKVIIRDFKEDPTAFKASEQKLALDMAVLIYDQSVASFINIKDNQIFTVAPKQIRWGDSIMLCGHGLTGDVAERYGYPPGGNRCGSALAIVENDPFYYESEAPELLKRYKDTSTDIFKWKESDLIKIVHINLQTYLREYGAGTRVGIGRLSAEGLVLNSPVGFEIEPVHALANTGDSGGPWFIHPDKNLSPHLIGVSTLTLVEWKPSSPRIIASLAWRTDDPEAKLLLKKAFDHGADIRGLQELLQSQ